MNRLYHWLTSKRVNLGIIEMDGFTACLFVATIGLCYLVFRLAN